jgi:hypothetical protein
MSQIHEEAQSTKQPERSEWKEFFESLTKEYEGEGTTIEVLDQEYGDQFEAETVPLAFVMYDSKDDDFIVAVGGKDGRYPVVLQHIIEHPQSILVARFPVQRPWVIDIVGADGSETIVTLHHREQ